MRYSGSWRQNFDVANAVKVGVGSLGDVLLAKELRQGLRVAVKVISLKKLRAVSNIKGESRQGEARVRREVKAMRELQHPNIVKILDVQASRMQIPMLSSEPPYICIVMEYVSDAGPLSVAIRKSRLGTPQVLDIIRQIGSALAQMHDQGLVHRDVWSENVLLTRSGHAVLIDLGCTESVCGPAGQDDLNIPYMSPEAAHGERQRSSDDCFSFGLLVTEMVTGRFVSDRMGRTVMPISLMTGEVEGGHCRELFVWWRADRCPVQRPAGTPSQPPPHHARRLGLVFGARAFRGNLCAESFPSLHHDPSVTRTTRTSHPTCCTHPTRRSCKAITI